MTRRKPPQLRIARATDQTAAKPRPPLKLTAPRTLKGVAKAAWKTLAPLLAEAGCLTAADLHLLEAYCETVATYRDAIAQVKEHGEIVLAATGTTQRNPYSTVARDAAQLMAKLGAQLGLSPASRARIGLELDLDAKQPPRVQTRDRRKGTAS